MKKERLWISNAVSCFHYFCDAGKSYSKRCWYFSCTTIFKKSISYNYIWRRKDFAAEKYCVFFLIYRDEGTSSLNAADAPYAQILSKNLYVIFSRICGVRLNLQILPVALTLICLISSYSTLVSVVPGLILNPNWHIIQFFIMTFPKILLSTCYFWDKNIRVFQNINLDKPAWIGNYNLDCRGLI
jgi:hypothetical protein